MSSIFDRMMSANEATSNAEQSAEPEVSPVHTTAGDATEGASRTASDVKKVTQELLRQGYLEEAQKPELFRRAVLHERTIMAVLEPLDLELRLDLYRGVAFLLVSQADHEITEDDTGWLHPLVRRQRLTLEQSLLVAILRQAFVIHEQESGVGQSAAKIAVGDLLPQFMDYFGDSGSDAKNESRLLNLLEQLKPHGIVSEIDKKEEVTIRPLIAHLANPESLAALLKVLKAQSQSTEKAEHES